jgi:methanogenic corrinoid protein MtbC1
VVVFAGDTRTSDLGARAVAASIGRAGVAVHYLGREGDAHRIAASVVDIHADAVEVCVAGSGAIALLRDLLRELRRLDRPGVSIVVHKVQ